MNGDSLGRAAQGRERADGNRQRLGGYRTRGQRPELPVCCHREGRLSKLGIILKLDASAGSKPTETLLRSHVTGVMSHEHFRNGTMFGELTVTGFPYTQKTKLKWDFGMVGFVGLDQLVSTRQYEPQDRKCNGPQKSYFSKSILHEQRKFD